MSDLVPRSIRPAFPERVPPGQVRAKLLELLGLDTVPEQVPWDAGETWTDARIRFTRIRFADSLGEPVPGILMVPFGDGRSSCPGVVCIPGTDGTADGLADARFEDPPGSGRVLGFGRELARCGYATLAISIKGSVVRRGTVERWEQEAKFLEAYGRPQMGIIAEEAIAAARVLSRQDAVDGERIGLTGMSLGGLASWYAMACAPWIPVGAPICGGLGSMARNIQEGLPDRSSSAIYVPHMLRHFDHPDIVAACIAPRAFLAVAPTEDEDMPRAGVDDLLRVVRPAYEAGGVPERLQIHQPPGRHEFLVRYFEWMVAWFDRFLS